MPPHRTNPACNLGGTGFATHAHQKPRHKSMKSMKFMKKNEGKTSNLSWLINQELAGDKDLQARL